MPLAKEEMACCPARALQPVCFGKIIYQAVVFSPRALQVKKTDRVS